MTLYNNDSFNYTSSTQKFNKLSKIELFMQKVQVAKDISKLKTLKESCKKLFKKETGNKHPGSKLYKSI